MSTSASMDDCNAIVTRLSKELELMGLPGLSSYHQQDYSSISDGAMVVISQEDVISDLISSSYDLIGLLGDLQRSKRQREDHAQQLIHDLQRSQWLLDKEKELSVQNSREAAEACERERQTNVRLQLSETLLKKKSEEHRQLVHECQLKENQWLHALRRRDQENHRLQQQLLKFLHTKSTGSVVPLQVEMRGTLVAPPRASSSDSTRLRKQWDRTPATDDTTKLVETKWKTALNSLEKEHQLLRVDYVQLVDMVGRFLTNCSARRPETRLFSNITEWIHLPVVSMKDRLEQLFRLVEDCLVSTTSPHSNRSEMRKSFDAASDSIDYGLPIGTNQITKPMELAVENQKVAANNCISPPVIKDKTVTGVTPSRSGISTHYSSAAQERKPFKMAKSVPHSTSTANLKSHQFDRLPADDPCSAFRNAARGNERPSHVVNQVDWNELKMPDNPPALATVFNSSRNTFMARQLTSETATPSVVTSSSLVGLKAIEDDHVKMATLDTPCPSASNSRSASSCSSTSSVSSWKSQQSRIDPAALGATGVDEPSTSRPTYCSSISTGKSGATSTVNLNRKTITAKVSFIQPTAHNVATPNSLRHSADAVDLHCCLIAQHNNSFVDT